MVCLPRLLRVNWSIMQDQTLLLDTGRLVRLALVTAQKSVLYLYNCLPSEEVGPINPVRWER
jgi:hypothetical protein